MKKEVLDDVMLNSYMEQKSTNTQARRNDLIQAVEAKVKRGRPDKSCFKWAGEYTITKWIQLAEVL